MRRSLAKLLPLLLACAIAAGASDAATVYLLVDASGSMRRDSQNWRREAAALLAYSLPAGGAMAVSGFGDPSRAIQLDPVLLSSGSAAQRAALAAQAFALSADDRQTDVFGALLAALNQAAALSPGIRRARPPAVVMLSDFQPDPAPSQAQRSGICRALANGPQLILVGVGNVDVAETRFLTGCAGDHATLIGPITDFSALIASFSTIEHQLSGVVPLAAGALDPGTRQLVIPAAAWADQVQLLVWSDAPGAASPAWQWQPAQSLSLANGRSFRLATFTPGAAPLAVAFGDHPRLHYSAVASGPVDMRLAFDPPAPWLAGESVSVRATLVPARAPATALLAGTGVDALSAAWFHTGSADRALLASPLNGGTAFSAAWSPRLSDVAYQSAIEAGGARWTVSGPAAVVPAPVALADRAWWEKPLLWPWLPQFPFAVVLRSALPGRSFRLLSPVGASLAAFGSRDPSATLWIAPHSPDPLTLQPDFGNQPATPLLLDISAVAQPHPIAGLAYVAALLLLFGLLIRGPKLGRGFLTDVSAERSRDPVNLGAYRRKLPLRRLGFSGGTLHRSWRGRLRVQLPPGIELRTADGDFIPGPCSQPFHLGCELISAANNIIWRLE